MSKKKKRSRFLQNLNSIKIGKKKKPNLAPLSIDRCVTRSITYSRNNLISEPGCSTTTEAQINRLEQ
jgi:hypothetical protein